MATIKDVAKAAGVSIASVSRVLSKSDYPVSEKTRQLILAKAEELGYSVNRVARSLRTDRSYMIGVILDHFESPWSPIIIRGLQDVFHEQGYFSLVINIPWENNSRNEVMHDLLGHSVDGFVFVETWHQVSESKEMIGDKPYVLVHRLHHESDTYSVIPDESHNTSLAVNHLIALNHQKIAYIKGPSNYFAAEERFVAYQNALERAGIPFNGDYVQFGDWEIPSGYQAACSLLNLDNPPTAIVAGSDLMAFGAICAIHDNGLRVPDDVAVVGNDNDEIASTSIPTITTVSLPLFEMGQVAAQRLLRQLNAQEDEQSETLVKGELIIRQSCGSPQGVDVFAGQYKRHNMPPIAE